MKNPADNSCKGYDIDAMTESAKDLGVKFEFVPTDWNTLVSGITAGKYHMTGSASILPARAKTVGYSYSYFSKTPTLITNWGSFSNWCPCAFLLPKDYQVWINYVNTWTALKR